MRLEQKNIIICFDNTTHWYGHNEYNFELFETLLKFCRFIWYDKYLAFDCILALKIIVMKWFNGITEVVDWLIKGSSQALAMGLQNSKNTINLDYVLRNTRKKKSFLLSLIFSSIWRLISCYLTLIIFRG